MKYDSLGQNTGLSVRGVSRVDRLTLCVRVETPCFWFDNRVNKNVHSDVSFCSSICSAGNCKQGRRALLFSFSFVVKLTFKY
jgi:hypothetical protein